MTPLQTQNYVQVTIIMVVNITSFHFTVSADSGHGQRRDNCNNHGQENNERAQTNTGLTDNPGQT
jgi:hypothetical protein